MEMILVSVCGTVCIDNMVDGVVDDISLDKVLEEPTVEHSTPVHDSTWNVCVEISLETDVVVLDFFEEIELTHCPLEHDSIEITFVDGV